MALDDKIRLNFSTRQHSHCHDVELVDFTTASLVVRARQDIPLNEGRLLRAGQKAWLPRWPMSPDPPAGEVLTRPSSLVIYPFDEAQT